MSTYHGKGTEEAHSCPACGTEICRTSVRWSWQRSIDAMFDAMEAHLPTCGPSNTPEIRHAANNIAQILAGPGTS